MATLIAIADGNLTGATTFAVAEAGTGALQLLRNGAETSFAASGTADLTGLFTITNAAIIDGVWLWLRFPGGSGTFKIDLQKSSVSQASVTINKLDLPSASFSTPIFLKFTSTATGDGTANWKLVYTTTGGGGSGTPFYVNGSTGGATRALRTTTTATPAAGDNLIICGELTGAGTRNTRAVTMNSTAATVYGGGVVGSSGVFVCGHASLIYGTTASTNYILRVNGDVNVYQFGTFNIGSSGAEIPRTSTAVLEFQPNSADGDYGLRCYDYSTVNIAGLSRTSGKNIVKCKLNADYTPPTSAIVSSSLINGSTPANTGLDASGMSMLTWSFVDNTTNASHGIMVSGGVVANVTQTASIHLARGTGLNNRYIRMMLGDNSPITLVTNGCYADFDLQAGTVGTCTAVGLGTATSATITPVGTGFVCKITGKVSSGSATTRWHIVACSAPGTISYVGNTTACYVYNNLNLTSAASIPDATFNVDTDTGWLSGDAIIVAATSRTYSECEIFPLNANAGASSITSAVHGVAHSGTAPAQGEVGLLTRNVRIRSTAPTLMSFVYCAPLAAVTASWAEFYYVGMNAAQKFGISIDSGTTANPKSFTYCSIHDCDSNGVVLSASGAGTSLNVTFSNNVLWNNYASHFLWLSNTITNNDYVIDNNLLMRSNGANSQTVFLSDIGGVVTNNTVVGTNGITTHGFLINEVARLGTFSGNTAHACGGQGLIFNVNNVTGVVDGFTGWRNGTGSSSGGISGGINNDLIFNDLTLFGNNLYGINAGSTNVINITGTSVICGESGYTSVCGISVTSSARTFFNVSGVDFVGTSIGLATAAPHTTADIAFQTATSFMPMGYLNDCIFNSNAYSKTAWGAGGYLGLNNFNQSATDHRCEMAYGLLQTDTSVYGLASPSMKMTPVITATQTKLQSAPLGEGIRVPVNSGTAITASVWVRKDVGYGGSQPRLMVRANPLIGITSDTVVASCTDTTSSPVLSTFDPLTPTLYTLSGGNLVATNTAGQIAEQGARVAPVAGKNSGKHYFEMTLTTRLSNQVFATNTFGLGLNSATYTQIALGAGVYNWGMVGFQGNATGMPSLGNSATGTVICFAVDFDNHVGWIRYNGTGNWNVSGTANPATNTGGSPIPAGMWAPAVTAGGNASVSGNITTANFGASTFTGAVPSGFTSGWLVPAGAPGTATLVQISGTSPTATADGVMEFFVDCDNLNGGFINIDDWAFTGMGSPVGGLKYWFNGAPSGSFGQPGGGLKYWFNGLPVIGGLGSGAAGYFWAGII